jgi:hypothetical protein
MNSDPRTKRIKSLAELEHQIKGLELRLAERREEGKPVTYHLAKIAELREEVKARRALYK